MKLFPEMKIKTIVVIYLSLVACSSDKFKLKCNRNLDDSEVKIYQPCKEFVFNARFWFKDTLVSDEVVSIFITGNLWEYSSDQMEALLIYKTNYDKNSIEKIRAFGINP